MAKQRIIAITGASGGLAQEIVKQLSPSDGIILLGRDKDKLEKCYRHVENKTCLAIDLRDDNAIKKMVDYLYQRFGRIDVFINNAGFGEFKSYDHYTSQEIRDMFDINTFATMTFSRLMAEKMVEQGRGHIINIASMAGKIATANSSVYAATKFAVIGFSDALRLELADKGVYVTTVNPGPIETSFFDQADPSGAYLESVKKFVLSPKYVAKKIVRILGKNKRELNLPRLLNVAHKLYTLFPRISDKLATNVFNYK